MASLGYAKGKFRAFGPVAGRLTKVVMTRSVTYVEVTTVPVFGRWRHDPVGRFALQSAAAGGRARDRSGPPKVQ